MLLGDGEESARLSASARSSGVPLVFGAGRGAGDGGALVVDAGVIGIEHVLLGHARRFTTELSVRCRHGFSPAGVLGRNQSFSVQTIHNARASLMEGTVGSGPMCLIYIY